MAGTGRRTRIPKTELEEPSQVGGGAQAPSDSGEETPFGAAEDGDGEASLESVESAFAGIDREALLAELGVAAPEAEEEREEEEEEILAGVAVGEVASEAVRNAALRLGIERLHPEQERVIDEVVAGRDVLMVLPTGFGKSACYQIPSMILEKPVLVASPLLALMRDQSEKLAKLDVPCVRLDGTVRGKERARALARVAEGGSLLVLTTPESLFNEEVVGALRRSGVSLVAVDEAHCISEWGYDFRPAYLQIGERIRLLGRPPILALTATATPKVRDAVQRFLGMEGATIVSSSPHRSNLAFDVVRCGEGARLRALLRLAFRVRRPGIIYCSTTREVDEIFLILQRFGIPCHRYHGKMSASERSKNQDGFMRRGRRTVMVATNAFGLGIDKADIRYVMHYHAPGSLEQYVQEGGRAGRDGRRANCILLYAPEDRKIHEALLGKSRVRPEQLYRLGRALAAWAGEEKTPSVAALALSANLGTRTTGALLALLEEATLVRFDRDEVHVTVPAGEIEEESRKLASQFETLRTQDARRLDAVAEYAEETGCRAAFLAGYFGEDDSMRCGLCDRCRGSGERPDSFFEPLTPPRRAAGRRDGRRGRSGGRRPHPFDPRFGAGRETGAAEGRGRGGRRGRRRGRGHGSHAPRIGGFETAPGADAGRFTPEGFERVSIAELMADELPEATGNHSAPRAPDGAETSRSNGEGHRRRRRRRGRRRGRWRGPRPPLGTPQGEPPAFDPTDPL